MDVRPVLLVEGSCTAEVLPRSRFILSESSGEAPTSLQEEELPECRVALGSRMSILCERSNLVPQGSQRGILLA